MELKTTTTTTKKTLLKYVVFWGKEKAQFRKKRESFRTRPEKKVSFQDLVFQTL